MSQLDEQPDAETLAGALTDALRDQLHGDERTATPYDVIRTIDSTIAQLQMLRDKAHREHVRRTNSLLADETIQAVSE